MNKKGAFMDEIQGLGIGIIGLAIIIGVGVVVLTQFGGSVANCPADYTWQGNDTRTNLCINDTDSATNPTTPTGAGWTATNYLNTQMGSTGLAGWVPAIIALVVGMLFLGMFLSRNRSF